MTDNINVQCRILNSNSLPCNWKGLKKDLHMHCKEEHKYNVSVGEKKQLAWKYKKIHTETVNLMWDDGELFWCHHKDHLGIMYWAASHITPKETANTYFYDLCCYMSGNPTKRMYLQENCLSHEENLDIVFSSKRCVAIPYEALKLYFGNGSLDILDQIIFTADIRKR